MKRLLYLATAAVVFMLILVPAALAQDADPHSPEPHPQVATYEELHAIAGQPRPAEAPIQQHPGEVPDNPGTHSPTAQAGPLPSTGGVSVIVILPAAAVLLMGSGVVAYAALRRRGSRSRR